MGWYAWRGDAGKESESKKKEGDENGPTNGDPDNEMSLQPSDMTLKKKDDGMISDGGRVEEGV